MIFTDTHIDKRLWLLRRVSINNILLTHDDFVIAYSLVLKRLSPLNIACVSQNLIFFIVFFSRNLIFVNNFLLFLFLLLLNIAGTEISFNFLR